MIQGSRFRSLSHTQCAHFSSKLKILQNHFYKIRDFPCSKMDKTGAFFKVMGYLCKKINVEMF